MVQSEHAATSHSLCHQCKQGVNSNELKVLFPSLFVSPSDTDEEFGVNEKQSEKIESVGVQTKKRKEIEPESLECAKSTVQSIDKMSDAVGWMASSMVLKRSSESYWYRKLLLVTRRMGLEAKAHRTLMVKIKANKDELLSTWDLLEEDEVTEKERKTQLIQLANSIYLPSKK